MADISRSSNVPVQQTNIQPNLKIDAVCKNLLLKKLSYGVICSVLSHFFILIAFLFVVNFDIINPASWLHLTFQTLLSFTTWAHILLFTSIMFAKTIMCAKGYIMQPCYCETRFERFWSALSLHNLVMGVLHTFIGALLVWFYLSLAAIQYKHFYVKCKNDDYCLVEGTVFMVLGGLWTGFFYAVQLFISDSKLVFPVVHQRQLLQFKTIFMPLFKKSRNAALWPTVYYIIFYSIWRSYFHSSTASNLNVQNDNSTIWLYFYTYLFALLYYFNTNMMHFLFELFLTEPIEFPIVPINNECLTLMDAINMKKLPIVRHLACLDLQLLSVWSTTRRRLFFTLSQPGMHPHTWNKLVQSMLALITEFTESLNKSADCILMSEQIEKYPSKNSGIQEIAANLGSNIPCIQSPTLLRSPVIFQTSTPVLQSPGRTAYYPEAMCSPLKYQNIRNMSVYSPASTEIVQISHSRRLPVLLNEISKKSTEKLTNAVTYLKSMRGIKFFFGELPIVSIQQCMQNGNLVIWSAQGLTNIMIASLKEDPYGIVQKDLPVIITSLVELKQSVDKLNKIPVLSRKGPGFDEFSYKMKNSVNAALRRSLFDICRTFGQYFKDIPLRSDVIVYLQNYL